MKTEIGCLAFSYYSFMYKMCSKKTVAQKNISFEMLIEFTDYLIKSNTLLMRYKKFLSSRTRKRLHFLNK